MDDVEATFYLDGQAYVYQPMSLVPEIVPKAISDTRRMFLRLVFAHNGLLILREEEQQPDQTECVRRMMELARGVELLVASASGLRLDMPPSLSGLFSKN